MITLARSTTAALRILPIVIPRRVDSRNQRLEFHVVFSFLVEAGDKFLPPSNLPAKDYEVPECLRRHAQPWPEYIEHLFKSETLGAIFDPALGVGSSPLPIQLHRPEDLLESNWRLSDASELWRLLVSPKAPTANESAAASSAKQVSLSRRAEAANAQITSNVLSQATANAWVATDLRPGHRIESVNSRRVARDVAAFVSEGATAAPSEDPKTFLIQLRDAIRNEKKSGIEPATGFAAFARERSGGEIIPAVVDGVGRDDPRFWNEILPELLKTADFRQTVITIRTWYQEYRLANSRTEFLRQSRFLESGKHRPFSLSNPGGGPGAIVPVSHLLDKSDDEPDFVRFLARFRQHPGLARRLYLTLRCSVDWKSGPAVLSRAKIAIETKDVPNSPFVVAPGFTAFDLDCNGSPYFRPAPKNVQSVEFHGYPAGAQLQKAEELYRGHHLLSTGLYLATQDDPSQAMLRAGNGVSDAAQLGSSGRRSDDLDDGEHAIHAVNIYARPLSQDGSETTVAASLKERSQQDEQTLLAFNQHATRILARLRRAGSSLHLVSTKSPVAALRAATPPIFFAESLMAGCAIFVQSPANDRTGKRWRSLHRRVVTLTIDRPGASKYVLSFEEEGFSSIVASTPPRPTSGMIKSEAAIPGKDDGIITFDLFDAQNKASKTISSQWDVNTKRQQLFQELMFAEKKSFGNEGDLIMLTHRPKPELKQAPTHADLIEYFPVLTDRQRVVKELVAKRLLQFESSVLLDCVYHSAEAAKEWSAPVLIDPFLTRFVNAKGEPIERPTSSIAESGAAAASEPEFNRYTVEGAERAFAQQLPPPKSDEGKAPEVNPITTPILTKLGPLNQITLGQLGNAKVQWSQWPDPRKTPEAFTAKHNPLAPLPENRLSVIAEARDAKLHLVRGRVTEVGVSIFAEIRSGSIPANTGAIAVDQPPSVDAAGKLWQISKVLSTLAASGGSPGTIVFGPSEASPIRITAGASKATVCIHCRAMLSGTTITLTPTSVELVAMEEVLSSVPTPRCRLTLQKKTRETVVVHMAFPDPISPWPPRYVHPLESLDQWIEVVTVDDSPQVIAQGIPQRPLATIAPASGGDPHKNRVLFFPDGQKWAVDVTWSAITSEVISGFLAIAGDTPTVADGVIEPILFAAEVARYDEEQDVLELTDDAGRTHRISKQGSVRLHAGASLLPSRPLRSLRPGEWLVVECHLESVENRGLRVVIREPSKVASADVLLLGEVRVPPLRVMQSSAQGSVVYRRSAYRSRQGRDLTVWSSAGAIETSPCISMPFVVGETLTQYVHKPAGIASATKVRTAAFSRRLSEVEPDPTPHHIMVSELIARWSGWSLGSPVPGRGDEDPKEDQLEAQRKEHFHIKLSRPKLDSSFPSKPPPYDRAGWLLPPLRFDQEYRICLRRTDLSGNHYYDESELPPSLPAIGLTSLTTGEKQKSFLRVSLPTAPLLAVEPHRAAPLLLAPPSVTPTTTETATSNSDFLYQAAKNRETQLVLLSDVFDPCRMVTDDASFEILPPSCDVETALLHGGLDGLPASKVKEIIAQHERRLDTHNDEEVLGRMRADGSLNYLPDPAAQTVAVKVTSLHTDLGESKEVETVLFTIGAAGSIAAPQGQPAWPNVRWLRLALQSVARRRRRSPAALPLLDPVVSEQANSAAASITTYLPPGAVGEATLSARPASLSAETPENRKLRRRMVMQHGRESRAVQLIHATNGALLRPEWIDLQEQPPQPLAAPSAVRDLVAELNVEKLTTGACAVTAYWNDPWDELVPVQHEPARIVVELTPAGVPVEAKVLEKGFGFGTQAILLYEAASLPYRKPILIPQLAHGRLVAFSVTDPGAGCNVLFRICVTQAAMCPCHGVRSACAEAWHDESGKLHYRILDPGECLGPCVELCLSAERPPMPEIAFDVKDGMVINVRLVAKGKATFARELYARIVRRPPFYRAAEGRVASFSKGGGLASIQVENGGGWYVNPPFCVAHDPAGDGFGAILHAKIDDGGGVCKVEVVRPGRQYSRETRIVFYNNQSEFQETQLEVERKAEPHSEFGPYHGPFAFPFKHSFGNPNARRVDYVARAVGRFRRFLEDDEQTISSHIASTPAHSPLPIRVPVPRFSPPKQLEILSHVRPEKPDVAYLMPAFRWRVELPKDRPAIEAFGYFTNLNSGRIMVRRDALLRVYLHRPWHSTGAEKLAVVLAPAALNTTLSSQQPKLLSQDGGIFNPAALHRAGSTHTGYLVEPVSGYAIDDSLRNLVSRMGFDPVWNEAAFPPLSPDYFPGRNPVTIYDQLAPIDRGSASPYPAMRPLGMALHDVYYDHSKELWYSDIDIDISAGGPLSLALPFVRLSVARYQEHGRDGQRLSPIALCDMYKWMGQRSVHIQRHGQREFTVRLEGEFDQTPGVHDFPRREVVARLEARDASLADEIVHYEAPGAARAASSASTALIKQVELKRNVRGDAYANKFSFNDEEWNSAIALHGERGAAVLSVLEFEIYPTPEPQSDATGTEVLVLDGRLCARRLVFSQSFSLAKGAATP